MASRSTTPDSTSVVELASRLRLTATRLARQLRQEAGTGLTPSQLSALASIDRHGPLALGDLADHERVAPPSITKVVTKLEADGLVSRQADPADRRFSLVTITARGSGLLAESRQRRNAWLAGRLRQLTPDQRDRLAEALDVLEDLVGGAP